MRLTMASTDLIPFSRVLSLQAADACSSAVGSGFAFVGVAVVKVWDEGPARLHADNTSPSAPVAPNQAINFPATPTLLPEERHEAVADMIDMIRIAFELGCKHPLLHRGADAEHQHEERH